MKSNIGIIDKVIRFIIAIGLALFSIYYPLTGAWKIIAYAVSSILVLTAVLGFCPLYRMLRTGTLNPKDPYDVEKKS